MQFLLIGVGLALVVWLLVTGAASVPPKKIVAGAKAAGVGLGLLGALWLLLTGRLGAALSVASTVAPFLARWFGGAATEAGDHRADESRAHAPPPTDARAAPMDREQAARLLGVTPDADADTIKAAYRRLMLKVHPDHGGTPFLAAQLTEARRVLLGEG